jgi:hypothetical protein
MKQAAKQIGGRVALSDSEGHTETTNKQNDFLLHVGLDTDSPALHRTQCGASVAHSTNGESLKLFAPYSFGCSVSENQFPQPSLNNASIP